MGSTISSNNLRFERKPSQNAKHQKKQGKRRDSVNRPVLKFQIRSNSMERQHRTNGQTSLDHPFLKRLSSQKYGAVDPLRDSVADCQPKPSFSMNDVTLTTTKATHTSLGVRTSLTTNKIKTISRSVSTGYESPSSPSLITLQFVDNGESTASLTANTEYEHLCLVQYNKTASNTDNAKSSGALPSSAGGNCNHSSVKKRVSILDYLTEPVALRHHDRAQSVDDLSRPKLCHKASIRISRMIKHTISLQDELEECGNIEVILNKEDWSFGENIMKCLEAEGIVLFNIEEPQTLSEREVDETWPELKNKMKQWRSEQRFMMKKREHD